MMKMARSKSVLAIGLVCLIASVSFGEVQTLGLWTFEGTAGATCAEGTIMPNLVEGAPEDLSVTVSTVYGSGQSVALPRYGEDLPPEGESIFADATMTTVLATLSTSIHVCTGTAQTASSYIRLDNLGKYVMTADSAEDFTIEMFVKPDMSPDNLYRAGLPGGKQYGGWNWAFSTIDGPDSTHSPAFAYGVYYEPGGCIKAPYGSDWGSFSIGNQKAWVQSGDAWRAKWQDSFYNGGWHHMALVYTASSHQMMLYIDYATAAAVTWSADESKGGYVNGIPLIAASGFQVLGRCGNCSNSHTGASVAALRLSKGAAVSADFMRMGHYVAPFEGKGTMGLWTFDGEPGTSYAEGTVVSNRVDGAPEDLVLLAATTNQSGQQVSLPLCQNDVPYDGCIYGDAAMTNVVADLKASVRVAVGSAANVGSFLRVEKLGRHVMTDAVPDDFTVEMFVKPDMSPANLAAAGLGDKPYGGWNWSFATISGVDASCSPAFGYGVYNAPGGCLRAPYSDYNSYSTGKLQGRDIQWVQQGVSWQKAFYNGEWHHVAFVYSKTGQTMSLYIDSYERLCQGRSPKANSILAAFTPCSYPHSKSTP